jgi:hypothetical protein
MACGGTIVTEHLKRVAGALVGIQLDISAVSLRVTSGRIEAQNTSVAASRIDEWMAGIQLQSGWWWGDEGGHRLASGRRPDGNPISVEAFGQNGASYRLKHVSGLIWLTSMLIESRVTTEVPTHLAETITVAAADRKRSHLKYRRYWTIAADGDAQVEHLAFAGFGEG